MSEQLNVYAVKTTCGRNFSWSAFDMEHLERSLKFHGNYKIKQAMPLEEYERLQAEKEKRPA